MPSSNFFSFVGLSVLETTSTNHACRIFAKIPHLQSSVTPLPDLELMFLNESHPKAEEMFLCIHRGFTFSQNQQT